MHRRYTGREAALSLLLALPFLLPLLLSLGFTFLGDWEVRQLLREVGRYEDGVFCLCACRRWRRAWGSTLTCCCTGRRS